jgi:hypothetical protein
MENSKKVISIGQKIVSQKVKDEKLEIVAGTITPVPREIMNEGIKRPDFLMGSTYKIKPPQSDNALYITINDIVLNEGTDHETRQPYEMFINSKSMEHYQWVVAVTRVISAIFRKGGDVIFLVEELASVYDPNGGYYKKGGKFMPSLVAEIGSIVEKHMKSIGLIETEELSQGAKDLIAEKRAKYEANVKAETGESDSQFPSSATICGKCNEKAVILMDGCSTCLNCGDGKCS